MWIILSKSIVLFMPLSRVDMRTIFCAVMSTRFTVSVISVYSILPNLMELRNRKCRGGQLDYLRVLDGNCILQLPFFDLSRGEEDSAVGVDFLLVSTID